MALVGSTVAVQSTATLLVTPGNRMINDPLPVALVAGSATIYIGGSLVANGASGIPVQPNTSVAFSLLNGDNLYAAAAATTTVYLLLGRQ